MKKILAVLIFALLVTQSAGFAYTRVSGYTRKNGTYVAPYYRSDSDGYKANNWSSQGNTNPFTGKRGYRSY